MMARGFKPVGWVAGVAAAALGCYMLSLNVAAERAELAKLEWRIITAKREIRTLQTELGTRGRLQQLENWNANVLALSAPTSDQFVDSEVTLARFDQREKTIEEKVPVQMASAQLPAPAAKIQAPVHLASAPASAPQAPSLVHRASVVLPVARPLASAPAKPAAESKKVAAEAKSSAEVKAKLADAKPAPVAAKKKAVLIDDSLVKEIRAAAKAEGKGSDGGR
jgi:hypothetical protein